MLYRPLAFLDPSCKGNSITSWLGASCPDCHLTPKIGHLQKTEDAFKSKIQLNKKTTLKREDFFTIEQWHVSNKFIIIILHHILLFDQFLAPSSILMPSYTWFSCLVCLLSSSFCRFQSLLSASVFCDFCSVNLSSVLCFFQFNLSLFLVPS